MSLHLFIQRVFKFSGLSLRKKALNRNVAYILVQMLRGRMGSQFNFCTKCVYKTSFNHQPFADLPCDDGHSPAFSLFPIAYIRFLLHLFREQRRSTNPVGAELAYERRGERKNNHFLYANAPPHSSACGGKATVGTLFCRFKVVPESISQCAVG